jgi:hypothetical protein
MPSVDFSTAESIRRGPRPGPSKNPFVSLRLLRHGGGFISRQEVAQRGGLTLHEVERMEAKGDGWLSTLGRYAEVLGGELQVSIKIGRYTFPIAFE